MTTKIWRSTWEYQPKSALNRKESKYFSYKLRANPNLHIPILLSLTQSMMGETDADL